MEVQKNVERLIQTLKDEDELVQIQSISLLEEIGKPAVEQLISALDDGNKNVRKGAARALGEIGDTKSI